MKGPKWLQKWNLKELQEAADPNETEFFEHPYSLTPQDGEHYLAGPGDGRILQEEINHLPNGNTLIVSMSNTAGGIEGAKYQRAKPSQSDASRSPASTDEKQDAADLNGHGQE